MVLARNEDIGSGGRSFDDDAGTDGFTSFGLSLFFLCFLMGAPASCISSSSASDKGCFGCGGDTTTVVQIGVFIFPCLRSLLCLTLPCFGLLCLALPYFRSLCACFPLPLPSLALSGCPLRFLALPGFPLLFLAAPSSALPHFPSFSPTFPRFSLRNPP